MFDNVFGFFKSSKDESAPTQQEQTWNATRMTMEQPTNYAANQQPQQPTSPEQMKLRGGGAGGGICCGICAGLACFECCEICC